jgi:hypothetical protein
MRIAVGRSIFRLRAELIQPRKNHLLLKAEKHRRPVAVIEIRIPINDEQDEFNQGH